MGEWKEYRLGDLISIKHGYAFSGTGISSEDNDIVLVTPGNFNIGGGFKEEKCKFFNGEYPKEFELKAGDLIVTMTDLSREIDTLGYSAIIPDNNCRTYLHNQRIGLVEIFEDSIVDKSYLSFLLRTKNYQKWIAGCSSGTTVHHTSPSKICEYKVLIPSLSEQRKIAGILSSLDEKIETNRRINARLEELAQGLFKSWFIDFEPFGGKMPEDWEECAFDDVVEVIAGGTPKTEIKEYWDGEIPWISVKDFVNETHFVMNTERCITKAGLAHSATHLLHPMDTIISARGTVGAIAQIQSPMAFNQSCFGLRSKLYSGAHWLYFLMRNKVDELRQKSHGSVFDTINRKTLSDLKITTPSVDTLSQFHSVVEPIITESLSLSRESARLAALRDALLPKLMSGEIKVE